ncbi:MAG: D-cysteine desulfhydrase family protein [Armatimonadota bacterium]|nr:D-cysteine desulfhydrase family protein [Armatimonadota bacterium]MDR5702184.1 D-cysteine desulfhydrase family protein [Armatimonadota bacterium]MDR7433928.1 D-cysteine desulfhydrase family protein [Armatimonadota bacterium]
MQLGRFPRVKLASLPTPLEEMPRLTEILGGPRLLIKRDDLTGLAMGGNKARKLEFLLGEARSRGADVVVTTGALQSNHARMTAAAAQKLGLRAILVLSGEEPAEYQGNLLLDALFGAEVRVIQSEEEYILHATMEDVARELSREGHRPYLIPLGGSTGLGACAYIEAALELLLQANAMGVAVDAIVHATSSGGTQAGLFVGTKLTQAHIKVVGISAGPPREVVERRVASIVEEVARLLQLDLRAHPDDLIVLDGYVGDGYGIPTPQCIDAIRLLARTEGILLDPVYTGKAMAGLIDLIRQGHFDPSQTVVFWHTGGIPALFAHARALSAPKEF